MNRPYDEVPWLEALAALIAGVLLAFFVWAT